MGGESRIKTGNNIIEAFLAPVNGGYQKRDLLRQFLRAQQNAIRLTLMRLFSILPVETF